jgi:superfamily II DNA or RNA helicase
MTTRWQLDPRIHLSNDRIQSDQGERQTQTAAEICRRLDTQPGVILADDVGMGKTFVAFAVAASIAAADPSNQIVVMVPSAVAQKWPSDWSVFEQNCVVGDLGIQVTTEAVKTGAEFLKLLDDPPERQKQIIFMTHRALYSRLDDPFVKLALIRQAFKWQRDLSAQYEKFPIWAARILRSSRFSEDIVRVLLGQNPDRWRATWNKMKPEDLLDDDPVPGVVVQALGSIDLSSIRGALHRVPLRKSQDMGTRFADLRSELRQPLNDAWRVSLSHISKRMPLLILDEAHHLKNPNRLRSLFDGGDENDGSEISGALKGIFERMLLMTATPFQLGHQELIRVLDLFESCHLPDEIRGAFTGSISKLSKSLDLAQRDSQLLDSAWGQLLPGEVATLPAGWWHKENLDRSDDVQVVGARARAAIESMEQAGEQLLPWVIRHSKPRFRSYRPGESILPTAGHSADSPFNGDVLGLEIKSSNVLPFLLAARAHAHVAGNAGRQTKQSRALFADGLASSYEAYLATRKPDDELIDESEDMQIPALDVDPALEWYLDQIAKALPLGNEGTTRAHPKVSATVERALYHWDQREKVLIFCFYRATGRALRKHLTRAVAERIAALAREKYPDDAKGSITEIFEWIDTRTKYVLRDGSPAARTLTSEVEKLGSDSGLPEADAQHLAAVTLSFMRTSSFVIRYIDLSVEGGAAMVENALDIKDGSGMTLREKLSEFAGRVNGMTERERGDLWDALERVDTGERGIDALLNSFEINDDDVDLRFPDVQLAYGATRAELRKRLMLRFNTPFPPEILVASSVMSEGVDLHMECRHLIHHDLDWSPSTLEQRTGRVDRIRSKSAMRNMPIVVCEPYVAGTQDEKQFTVVKDREQWFGVVMGGRMPKSERETDEIAERAEVPEALLAELTLDLSVYRGEAQL